MSVAQHVNQAVPAEVSAGTTQQQTPPQTSGTQRGRGNWRGRGPRGRGTGRTDFPRVKKEEGPIVSAPKIDPTKRPQPKAASTTNSPLSNDPMWQDFDAGGFEGLVPYRKENTFANTYEGLIAIAEMEYEILCSSERTFSKFISKACFVWYITEIFYGRCIAIRAHRGEVEYIDEQFRDYVRSDNYPVPVPIEEYLRSIGSVADKAGTEYKLRFPAWPNRRGHFGRVSAETHQLYESFPAPAVVAKRIQEDLRYTINPAGNRN
jgi:hypothetical protein